MNTNFSDKIFYHIYALGLGNCPRKNDFSCPAGNFFERLTQDLERIQSLGFNAILIGPIFESSAHGYDTVDYYHVDRRLGNNESFKAFSEACHSKGIALVLDAVFNHTGRNFFAFRDIQQNGKNSQYTKWYTNLHFDRQSSFGDCFDYDGWAGCKDLVKLNVDNLSVQEHLFGAVKFWYDEFKIDGLRLDAADVLSPSFLDALGSFCRNLNPNFWLMGEVVHGNYCDWAREGRIDSVTNYQIYKALWSSLNDQNLFELSYNLDREFSETEGLYKNLLLYNFVDNHDVNRVGSSVKNPEKHLALLYTLLFSIPGIPSVYYGSEYGIRGERGAYDDYDLRPCLPPFTESIPQKLAPCFDASGLLNTIKKLCTIRKENSALQTGTYRKEFIQNRQFAFWRESSDEKILVLVNSDFESACVKISNCPQGFYEDLLEGKTFHANDLKGLVIPPTSLMMLRRK